MNAWPLGGGALLNLVLCLTTDSETGSAVLFAVSTVLFWMFLAVLLKPKDTKNEGQG